MRHSSLFRVWALSVPLLCLLLASACSKEDVNAMVEKTKQTVSDATSKAADSVKDTVGDVQQSVGKASTAAKESLQLAGKVTLQGAISAETNACYGRLVTFTDGRPSVLLMQSYADASQETFPAVFFHAQVTASQPSELVGTTFPATLFVQQEAQGAIWFCDSTQPVPAKIDSLDNGMIKVSVLNGKLVSSLDGSQQPISAQFEGVMQ